MAVARDANATSETEFGTLPGDFTNLTVGSGSDRALLVQLIFDTTTPGTVTVTWDQGGTNQACTEIISQAGGGSDTVSLWGLINPIAGNKTLRVTATVAGRVIVNATSYTGVDQTSVAVAFPNATSATGTSTTVSVTITSATGNMTVDAFTAGVGSATASQTELFFLSGAGPVDGGASEAAGAASNTHQWTISSTAWAVVGTDILAADAGAATAPRQRLGLLGVS